MIKYASDSASKYIPKELVKADEATQFIGDGAPGDLDREGYPFKDSRGGSSTWRYKKAYEKFGLANTGRYSPEDKIMVASNGSRSGAVSPVNDDGTLNGVYKHIRTAMAVGATFLMDTERHLDKTREYNTGEVALAAYMERNGYRRDPPGSGRWVPCE